MSIEIPRVPYHARLPLLALAALAVTACGGEEAQSGGAAETGPRTAVSSMSGIDGSGVMGSLMRAPAGDRVTVKVEVLGVKEKTDYRTVLHRGTCERPGDEVTTLEPLGVNTLGIGSSSTVLEASALAGEELAVMVYGPDGTALSCGTFGG